jgi:hypothetical protein
VIKAWAIGNNWQLTTDYWQLFQAGLITLPDLKHRVHTWMERTEPWVTALTLRRFGFQRRLVWLLAWLTLLPTVGRLPQMSHI